MARFPALPLWTDAFLADTVHLDATETGAYLMLLMAAWRRPNCDLPNDDKLLARYARCSDKKWQRIKPTVLAFFDAQKDDHSLTQKRLTKEHKYQINRSSKASTAAKAMWLKAKETVDTSAPPKQPPEQPPKQKPSEAEASSQAPHKDMQRARPSTPLPTKKERKKERTSQTMATEGEKNKNDLVERGPPSASVAPPAQELPGSLESLVGAVLPNDVAKVITDTAAKVAERERKRIDYSNPENRQSYANSKIAEFLGSWDVVMTANDPEAPDHQKAAKVCLRAAKKLHVTWTVPTAGD